MCIILFQGSRYHDGSSGQLLSISLFLSSFSQALDTITFHQLWISPVLPPNRFLHASMELLCSLFLCFKLQDHNHLFEQTLHEAFCTIINFHITRSRVLSRSRPLNEVVPITNALICIMIRSFWIWKAVSFLLPLHMVVSLSSKGPTAMHTAPKPSSCPYQHDNLSQLLAAWDSTKFEYPVAESHHCRWTPKSCHLQSIMQKLLSWRSLPGGPLSGSCSTPFDIIHLSSPFL